jgi:hypothetical protein
MAARNIMRRVADISSDALSNAKERPGAPVTFGPGWSCDTPRAAATAQLEKFFAEIEGEPCEALDPANPFWDFSLEADSGGDFDAGYNDSGGASLHL